MFYFTFLFIFCHSDMLTIIAQIPSQSIDDDKIIKIVNEHKIHTLKHIIKNIQLINYV